MDAFGEGCSKITHKARGFYEHSELDTTDEDLFWSNQQLEEQSLEQDYRYFAVKEFKKIGVQHNKWEFYRTLQEMQEIASKLAENFNNLSPKGSMIIEYLDTFLFKEGGKKNHRW